MEKITIVQNPRPEDDKWTLPTYHQMLNHLCNELHVPGSQTFCEAIQFLKEKYHREGFILDSKALSLRTLIHKITVIRKAAEASGERMFLGIPDSWYELHKFRCTNDHVSSGVLLTEDGDRCLACSAYVMMTFPEDEDGPLKNG